MEEKNLVYRGKSKDVFNITEGPYAGKYRFVFTDRATGMRMGRREDGPVASCEMQDVREDIGY